ncbi:RNA 2',3'-cyclic phosphodiesterase [Cellulomonas soli]|uniref:RNA 2',3'-cyclic phosphodiesterase n=1 Tax=Cellulomonas soli TaxID=931535 RepID=A0A512PBS2_9CELL|nr:RNA 2',3'-cyclic phosphodiesterase [Cellulomonas soli]
MAVVPPEEVLDHLDLVLASVRGAPAGAHSAVRWSARETWHLTAAFFGEVADGLVPTLTEGLSAAAAGSGPYDLRLRGAGVFAHRTLWVGVAGDVESQRAVSLGARSVGEQLDLRPDDRVRDRPHLTIGRVRPGARPPGRRATRRGGTAGPDAAGRAAPEDDVAGSLVRALAVYEGPTWRVDRAFLVESTPGAGRAGGPLYRTVVDLPFEG